ncbi:MAG TPA: dTDP-4-dehydrorhamnose reductase [Serratia grimesii]|jgi:dTDP-4-dehydrorhamnose reductase|uniref:dTDP-4-dehydrorhamnose reductase n=1 Tax=Serratia grimesii TaxID=82995 RepID=A0A9C7V9T8_9GAMM|nr:dTDP-4-dehydrorhamnose reductase [Serratia grimesii]HCK02687.1 dTDP-4-dehydrorhamnose reductase [Serratia grimesii]
MKILLTGSKGQLGSCFQDRLPTGWDVWATDSDMLDITNLDSVKKAVEQYKPDVIVNAAAYTAVDKAESEVDLAVLVNEIGPRNLAEAANIIGARLVHVSTDYVFDGRTSEPYLEIDATNPLGIYGKTKLDGEIAVTKAQSEAIIIRTAWVFSEYGNNFLKTMLRLSKERDVLNIVSDQRGCPTYAGDIAHAIIALLKKNSDGGIYHFTGSCETSWSDFAISIFSEAGKSGLLTSLPTVKPISTDMYPVKAQRPQYSVLNCDKIRALGIFPSNLQSALSFVIEKISLADKVL